jgi:hypothetical protein
MIDTHNAGPEWKEAFGSPANPRPGNQIIITNVMKQVKMPHVHILRMMHMRFFKGNPLLAIGKIMTTAFTTA